MEVSSPLRRVNPSDQKMENWLVRYQPDVTITTEYGFLEMIMEASEEFIRGAMATASTLFTYPDEHIWISPRTPESGMIIKSSPSTLLWDREKQTWSEYFEETFPDRSGSTSCLLLGPYYYTITVFESDEFLDGMASACQWFEQDYRDVFQVAATSSGREILLTS